MTTLSTALSASPVTGVRFASSDKKSPASQGAATDKVSISSAELKELLDTVKRQKEMGAAHSPEHWEKVFEEHPPKSLGDWKFYFSGKGPGGKQYQTPRIKRFFAFARPKRLINGLRDVGKFLKSLPKAERNAVIGGMTVDATLDSMLLLTTMGLWAIPMVMTSWASGMGKRVFYHSVMSQYEADRYGDKAAKMPPMEPRKVDTPTKKADANKVEKTDAAKASKKSAKTDK